MLLVIDVGNTNIVLGIYKKSELFNHWRIRTINNTTEDEFNIIITSLFNNSDINKNEIKKTVISSVVPNMIIILESFCSKYLGHNPIWINPKSCSLPIAIENIDELGADRIVNSVAGYNKYKKSIIIVDFGTATTFDSISDDGVYLGGAISPGIIIASEALFNKASKLPRVDIFKPPKFAIGTNTKKSIQSGILYGYAGLVDGIVRRIISEMGDPKPFVIATGGLSRLISSLSETIDKIEIELTLEGLRIIGSN